MAKDFSFQIDDRVFVRNYRQRSKFDPYFLPEKCCVIDILANGNIFLIENTVSGLCLQRNPSDIKLFNGSLSSLPEHTFKNDNDENLHCESPFGFIAKSEHSDNDESFQKTNLIQAPLRRLTRLRRPNPDNYIFLSGFFSTTILFTGLQGKGEGISLTPHYHFHPLHRHLDISRAITAESSPLRVASTRTRSGNLWFPSASR